MSASWSPSASSSSVESGKRHTGLMWRLNFLLLQQGDSIEFCFMGINVSSWSITMPTLEVVPSFCQCTYTIVSSYNIFLIVSKYLLFQLAAPEKSGDTETLPADNSTISYFRIHFYILWEMKKIDQGTLLLINTSK